MYEGTFQWYVNRIDECRNYGFKAGNEILDMIERCVYHDKMLDLDECVTLLGFCSDMHIKLLEDNYNEE